MRERCFFNFVAAILDAILDFRVSQAETFGNFVILDAQDIGVLENLSFISVIILSRLGLFWGSAA